MRKHYSKSENKGKLKISSRCFAMLLVMVLLVQSLAFGASAVLNELDPFTFGSGSGTSGVGGIANIDSESIIAGLKKDLIATLNKDLVKHVSEYELTGPVGLIISFSDDSLVGAYSSSKYADRMTYQEFQHTNAADKLEKQMLKRQSRILKELTELGLITEVEYGYVHIMDGAFVQTTFENIDAICNVSGVERVMVSNTYLPAAAVENPVDVYDTGIFNSGTVDYTGKGTIVAILDTGCDYTHSAFTTYQVVDPKYNRDDIAALLEETRAYKGWAEFEYEDYAGNSELEAREVYYGNLTGNKIAFGFDYADKDSDVMPYDNSHGTHVAGIIGGYDDVIKGVAIDTQFAIMKVFSDYEAGAQEGDILAALEDSVVLGVDAINMSLGSSCGFSAEYDESDPIKQWKNEVYNKIEEAGISLIVAASNDYSSGFGNEQGNTNKTDNPDSATVGSPSTYSAALSVASINGNKDNYMLANGNREVFFIQSSNTAAKPYDFFEMLGIKKGDKTEYEYVTVPGVGKTINYAGIDVNGKIALVKRGDITFEEKVQYAAEAGAIAVIIYNNVFGDISMTIGNDAKIPAVSIGKDDGEALAAHESGTIVFDLDNVAGPFMSDFSSWGPNPDLTLKPEITAHGGNIYSSVIGGEYDKMSGTSMAAPNMCGITVLIRQYVKNKYPEMSAPEVRDLVNQLCMSTATIALDHYGNPYSPRKQGAGIADIAKSTTTGAYLFVDGLGKTKLELGDDPKRTGVYEMTVNLKNISDSTVSYKLGNITMTESVSTSDPEYVAEIAYILSPDAVYSVEGGTLKNGIVSVAPGAVAKITLKLTLPEADKQYISSTFENGMYVEGYFTFTNTDENGVDLNAPFLAFYGNWGDAPIFDLDYYEVETEAHNGAIDEDDKIKADYYATTPAGSYYYDYVLPLGTYVYKMSEGDEPIPATQEHAAISYFKECISGIYGVFTGLLRGAREMKIEIVDTTTGKVVWEDTQYNCYKAHYSGAAYPYFSMFQLPTADYETGEVLGNNNAKFEVTMSAKLDWDGGENISDTYSFSFYIDYEAPTVTDAKFYKEYDKATEEYRYYVDVMIYDNHYAMSCRPIVVYQIANEEESDLDTTYAILSENPLPIYQENRGEASKLKIEITDYLDLIAESQMPNGLTLYIDDYAMNASVNYIPFPETEDVEDIEFIDNELQLGINETFDLTTLFVHKDNTPVDEIDYLKTLKWYSSDESVVKINGGRVEALKSGSATISVTSDSWVTKTKLQDGLYTNVPIYKKIVIKVSDTVVDNDPNSGKNNQLEELKFVSYNTKFAFSTDIDYSEIGITNSMHYFTGAPSISFYPSEKVQLNYLLKPWNLSEDRYELIWESNNPKVATVDENGVVTAESEGNARITLKIKVDGKVSTLAARCSITVKSEFIIENRELVAYKGKGGDVVIPDDEGILYIGKYAFSHYDLFNDREVEKDENGYYDMDLKKDAIGNTTVTSVVIPEGVETINNYAFYNCQALESVTLPTTCKQIGYYSFAKCSVLQNVNFDNVKIVSNYAFMDCESLSCDELGGANMKGIYTIGDYAFANTRFSELELLNLSRIGVGIFSNCSKLTSVTLGERTRVGEKMFMNTPLQSVVIYSDMIGDEAFSGCKKLQSVTLKNDVTYVGNKAFYEAISLNSFVAEGAVEQIAAFAFYGCSALKSFTLPNSAVSISDGAFGSTGLNTLVFKPDTVISYLGMAAFEKVSSLTFDVSASDCYTLENGVLYTNSGTELVLVAPRTTLTAFVVPKEVVKIADGAFSSLTKLKSVSFESGSKLATIGENAFASCIALNDLQLPNNPITIGDAAFYSCSALKTLDLSNVTSIGDMAFAESGITAANIVADDVNIGFAAFYNCAYLKTVSIGDGAFVGEYAFSGSAVKNLTFLGDIGKVIDPGYLDGVKYFPILNSAFAYCADLTSVDMAGVSGEIGAYAFYQCTALSSFTAPEITAIGESSFSDCFALSSFSAKKLETIGDSAFAPISETATTANRLTEVDLPSLKVIGDNAFYGSLYLKSIDLSGVTDLGKYVFAVCQSLESVVGSGNITSVGEFTFYGCSKLSGFDYSGLVSIGSGAFYGVQLPEHLDLSEAETLDVTAFVEDEGANNLVTVNAPKLKSIGEQGFAGCAKLQSIYAPNLESIGYAAFAYTAIEELEVSDSLRSNDLSYDLFEGSTVFRAFYATVDGEKVYDVTFDEIMIKDGVLYKENGEGYTLVTYPAAKTDSEFTVPEGVVRIEFCAFYMNGSLTKVTLPTTLKYISNSAFLSCENLNTVVFRSYYAPVLEGTMTGEVVEITHDNVSEYSGFDKLYGYDYYYQSQGVVGAPLYYNTFGGQIGSKDAEGLIAVLPDNCEGYDTLLYNVFFTVSDETSGVTEGKYAVKFKEAVSKLPETVDRYDKIVVEAAINAYNALEGHADEKQYVSADVYERFNKARSEYYVDDADYKINHIFDIGKNQASFDKVKEARAAYNMLSETEKAMVDGNLLNTRIAELNTAFGTEIDFSKNYEDYVKDTVTPEPTPDPDPEPTPKKLSAVVIVLIVVGSVAVAGGIGFAAFLIIKKKKSE